MQADVLDNRSECTGCGACMQKCSLDCISMRPNEEGFLYPVIDTDKCTDCGLCRSVCPVLNYNNGGKEDKQYEVRAFAGYHSDEDIRADSSSGGVFTAFAHKVLTEGGIVCGCTLDEDNHAVHICIQMAGDIHKLRGSKYVQSDTGDSYEKIKEYLKNDRYVLFTGTPCQCAGLRSFLNEEYEKLITCDFICHGVPSPLVFDQYIKALEDEHGSRVVSFKFRNKDRGWNQSGMQPGTRIEFDNGETVRKYPAFRDEYMNGFLSDIYLRSSCYKCLFKGLPHICSDITIADFWGINSILPGFNDNKGTSLVMINSTRGLDMLKSVGDLLVCKEVDPVDALKRNPMMTASVRYNPARESFFKRLASGGYKKVRRRYMGALNWAFYRGIGILKNREELLRFIKFSLVGVSNSVVSYTINVSMLLMLKRFDYEYDYIIANCTAFLLSVLWSYNLNSRHVFTVRPGETRSAGRTLLKSYVSYGFSGIILNNLLGTLWIRVLGISRFISPILNLFFTVPTNYLLSRFWTYRTNKRIKK